VHCLALQLNLHGSKFPVEWREKDTQVRNKKSLHILNFEERDFRGIVWEPLIKYLTRKMRICIKYILLTMHIPYTRTYSCTPPPPPNIHLTLNVGNNFLWSIYRSTNIMISVISSWCIGAYLSFFTRTWLQLPGAAHRSTALVTPTEIISVTLKQL
jgi:hypothetical protein